MPQYIQLEFQKITPAVSDLLVAELSHAGFEGFEEEEGSLKAFIPVGNLDESALDEIIARNRVSFHRTMIEETNWNAVWESGFQPVVVDDFLAVRAAFHKPVGNVEHEIVITPKMSFGTGHHATTYMMIQQMRKINFAAKKVFDFGTGTGVLAILAEKLGADYVLAADHDEWSIDNAAENIEFNNCNKIKLENADRLMGDERFDIILANINKNVILDQLSSMVKHLSPGGKILVSGLLVEDEPTISVLAKGLSLQAEAKIVQNGWICLMFG